MTYRGDGKWPPEPDHLRWSKALTCSTVLAPFMLVQTVGGTREGEILSAQNLSRACVEALPVERVQPNETFFGNRV